MPRPVPLVLGCVAALAVAFLLAPAGASAVGWEPPVSALNGTGGEIRTPRVAVDDAGNVYAAWTEGGLMEVSKRPVGGVFEQPQTLEPTVTTSANPDIGVDGAGNAVVVWREGVNADTNVIRQATRAAGATSFSTGADVSTGTPSLKDNPKLAVNRAGDAVLAIQTPSTGVGTALVALGSATGGFTTAATQYSEGPNSQIFPPDAAINEAGDAVVAWRAVSSGSTRMHAAYRPHGGALSTAAENILPPGSTGKHEPSVAIDSQGNAIAVWDEDSGGAVRAYARSAGASGTWAFVSNLDAANSGNGAPVVAFDATDTAFAAWRATSDELRESERPPGGLFTQPPRRLGDAAETPIGIAIDASPRGIALAWQSASAPARIRGTFRPSGGPFPFDPIATAPDRIGSSPDIAADMQGNAAAVWIDNSNPLGQTQLATAEYDRTRPHVAASVEPLNAFVGEPVSFSAVATDDWSQPTVSWFFGDNTSAAGSNVTHAYAKPETYVPGPFVLDGASNDAGDSFVVIVAPVPTRGVDFNASSVSGKVLVSVPKNGHVSRAFALRAVVHGAAAAIRPPKGYRGFRRLGSNDTVPIGSIIDAGRGVTELHMAKNASSSERQSGRFSHGVFKTLQSETSALTTAVLLGGGNFRKQCKAFGFLAKRKHAHRRLFGNVHGRFRTRGRHSTATVSGTKWTMTDTCSGTLTAVSSGSVKVFDFGTHKTKVVRAGHRYLARSRKTG